MAVLQKITTTYCESEDRLRLAGLDVAGETTVMLWLTQRIANRLVRALTQWLEAEDGAAHPLPADLRHAWAQEAAVRQFQPSAPVRLDATVPATLVESIDLARDNQIYTIGFRRGEDSATLNLSSTELRQWLGIVRALYHAAGWPLADWPGWMEEAASVEQSPARLH